MSRPYKPRKTYLQMCHTFEDMSVVQTTENKVAFYEAAFKFYVARKAFLKQHGMEHQAELEKARYYGAKLLTTM